MPCNGCDNETFCDAGGSVTTLFRQARSAINAPSALRTPLQNPVTRRPDTTSTRCFDKRTGRPAFATVRVPTHGVTRTPASASPTALNQRGWPSNSATHCRCSTPCTRNGLTRKTEIRRNLPRFSNKNDHESVPFSKNSTISDRNSLKKKEGNGGADICRIVCLTI